MPAAARNIQSNALVALAREPSGAEAVVRGGAARFVGLPNGSDRPELLQALKLLEAVAQHTNAAAAFLQVSGWQRTIQALQFAERCSWIGLAD